VPYLSSCSKDDVPFNAVTSEVDYNPEAMILRFKSKAMDPLSMKNGFALELDSTVWYVEAALNHQDTDPTRKFNDYVIDTVFLEVPQHQLVVAEQDALGAYVQLQQLLAQKTLQEGYISSVIDVEGYPTENSLVLVAYRVSGGGGELEEPKNYTINSNFGVNDKYRWTSQLGVNCYCGPAQQPPIPNKCADRIIQDRLNSAIVFPVGPNQSLTDVQIWTITGDPDESTNIPQRLLKAELFPNPNYSGALCGLGQFLTFETNGSLDCTGINPEDTGECLNSGMMSLHTQGALTTMLSIRQQYIPNPNIKPITSLIQGQIVLNFGGFTAHKRWHRHRYTYGRYYTSSNSGS